MLTIDPVGLDPVLDHQLDLWTHEQCYRYYVGVRREFCAFLQLLDIWLYAPLCPSCNYSQPMPDEGPPNISPKHWENDLLSVLGYETTDELVNELDISSHPGFCCKRCGQRLRPWRTDDIYIAKYHLEEHYGIPIEAPERINASKRLKKQIFALYGSHCFNCPETRDLHIDHTRPGSLGGDSASRNLQPLCESCVQREGAQKPEEVTVYSVMYFTDPPSDCYEGLFW